MKHIINVVGMLVTAVVFFLLMVFVEENYVLNAIAVPTTDTLPEWLDSFRHWGTISITVSAATSLLWYLLGQWMFDVNRWPKANRRPVWFLLFLGPVIAAALGVVFTKQLQEGAWVAFLFYFLNGTLSYYFATALFSPSAFKYIPLGASKLRRWSLAFDSNMR